MSDLQLTAPVIGFLQDAPPLAGQPVPVATTGAPGTAADGAAQPARGAGDPFGMMWILIPFLVIMIFVSVMGSRREKKKRESLMNSMKKHDEVQTAGGIIGSVVEIKDDTVILKIDENSNVRMTFAKSAIVQIVSSGAAQGLKS